MATRKTTKKVDKNRLVRAVASSTAIETGESVEAIEARLKARKSKYQGLALAQ